ncbi:hypothetical protein F5Y13DRAFT_163467 [Hypoxylon sp. FL1857]|nr:hypothetical protein F5Y13DRAFT_163467 [Hypoxylon sp. FL1857]
MSSFGRYIPLGLAVAFGIWNGYYAFKPAFKELQMGSQQSLAKDLQPIEKQTDANNQQKPPKDDASSNR